MRDYPLPPSDDERPPQGFGQQANRTDKALTVGILGAGIVAALLLIGSIFFSQSSEEPHANQPSTQSLAGGNGESRTE
jgi:hypothetical protein